MLRITGGEYGGRRLTPPPREVRPTKDRVRESLFAILGDAIEGSRVLDLFAGSGAMGLEAASRGAASVVWVEQAGPVYRVLERNVAALSGPTSPTDAYRCARADVWRYLRGRPAPVDVVIADPPYAMRDALPRLLDVLVDKGGVRKGGLLIFERSARSAPALEERKNWMLLRARKYGKTEILIWRREADNIEGAREG